MADVTIIGAGPVGPWTAAELARRGVDVVVLERPDRPNSHSKALAVHPRALEVLDQRDLAGEPLDRGIRLPDGHFAILEQRLDYGVLDTPHPFLPLYPQHDTEVLLERAQWSGVPAAPIRPDGYVAWATEADDTHARDELIDAAARPRPGIG